MIVTLTVLAILATAAMPIAKTAIQRDKELELRRALREIREALDAYKKLADEKKIEVEEDIRRRAKRAIDRMVAIG
jgi:general secretion pathway protein G